MLELVLVFIEQSLSWTAHACLHLSMYFVGRKRKAISPWHGGIDPFTSRMLSRHWIMAAIKKGSTQLSKNEFFLIIYRWFLMPAWRFQQYPAESQTDLQQRLAVHREHLLPARWAIQRLKVAQRPPCWPAVLQIFFLFKFHPGSYVRKLQFQWIRQLHWNNWRIFHQRRFWSSRFVWCGFFSLMKTLYKLSFRAASSR